MINSYLKKRKNLIYCLILSLIISFVWVLIAKDYYAYNKNFPVIAGIDIFPFLCWTIGLFLLYFVYLKTKKQLKLKGLFQKIVLFTAIYWPSLIIIETIGYHILDIKDVALAKYNGLPVCDCIHAPIWMKITYFSLGIIFFMICYLLKLEDDS